MRSGHRFSTCLLRVIACDPRPVWWIAPSGTVTKLLRDVGAACLNYQDETLRGLTCKRVQCDEIWSFVGCKEKNKPKDLQDEFGLGDVWTWVAICADSKLVPCWLVGPRHTGVARVLMENLAGRLTHWVQLTTDGHRAYLDAVDGAFGFDVDYAMLVKIYGQAPEGQKRYSPARS